MHFLYGVRGKFYYRANSGLTVEIPRNRKNRASCVMNLQKNSSTLIDVKQWSICFPSFYRIFGFNVRGCKRSRKAKSNVKDTSHFTFAHKIGQVKSIHSHAHTEAFTNIHGASKVPNKIASIEFFLCILMIFSQIK